MGIPDSINQLKEEKTTKSKLLKGEVTVIIY